MYTKISELFTLPIATENPRVAVVNPYDPETLGWLLELASNNIIELDLIGNTKHIRELLMKLKPNSLYDSRRVVIHSSENPAQFACELIKSHKTSVLMKGDIHTSEFLKAIIKSSLVKPNCLLTHLVVYEVPNHKLVYITDPSICIEPNTEQKIKIVSNAVEQLHSWGYKKPKVAALSSVEYEDPMIPSSVLDARLLSMFNHGEAVIEGPLGLDNAVSTDAATKKHLKGEIQGDADILLVPNMDCGNLLCKGLRYLGALNCGNLILGSSVPIVFTSRSANYFERLNSLNLAISLQQ